MSTKNIEERLMDISKIHDVDPESIRRMYKLKTMLDYFDAKDKHKKRTQEDICQSLGISRSTLFRIRRDVGMKSLNRYEVPITTEAQRKKDKLRRTLNKYFTKGLIDETEKDSLQGNINEGIDVTQRFTEIESKNNNKNILSRKSGRKKMAGGGIGDDKYVPDYSTKTDKEMDMEISEQYNEYIERLTEQVNQENSNTKKPGTTRPTFTPDYSNKMDK